MQHLMQAQQQQQQLAGTGYLLRSFSLPNRNPNDLFGVAAQ